MEIFTIANNEGPFLEELPSAQGSYLSMLRGFNEGTRDVAWCIKGKQERITKMEKHSRTRFWIGVVPSERGKRIAVGYELEED